MFGVTSTIERKTGIEEDGIAEENYNHLQPDGMELRERFSFLLINYLFSPDFCWSNNFIKKMRR